MKKLLILIGVVATLLLGGYYTAGLITERSFNRLVQDIRTTKHVDLKIVKYNRGLFTSTALINWNLQLPSDIQAGARQNLDIATQNYLLPINLDIFHGPIIIAKSGLHVGFGFVESILKAPQAYKKQLENILQAGTKYPVINIGILISFFNEAELHISIPAFNITMHEKLLQFDFKGFKASSTLALSLKHLKGDSQLSAVNFRQGDIGVKLDKVNSEYKLRQTKLGLYDGTAIFNVQSLQLENKGQVKFAIEDFKLSSSNKEKRGLFSTEIKTGINKLIIETITYGPLVLELALDNLDATVLAKIRDQWQEVGPSAINKKQTLFLTILPELPALLSKGITFSVPEFSFVMPGGELKADLSISLLKNSINNPFQILSHLFGFGHAVIPAKIMRDLIDDVVRKKLEQTPTPSPTASPDSKPVHDDDVANKIKSLRDKRLSSLVESGAIVASGNDYTIDVKLEQGRITVNGKPFAPAMLEF